MKIVILGAYFGKFPSCINLWLKSCEYNKSIDYMIFTDQKFEQVPSNVEIVDTTLEDVARLASKKLGIRDLYLKAPYKLCDLKPTYGIIFEDYIKGYDFWAHCDFDMIFGNIKDVIDQEIWKKYDKILPLGHLSFYRNKRDVNERYKINLENIESYLDVFTTSRSFGFDEYSGMIAIYGKMGFPFYKQKDFVDISRIYKRMRLAETPEFDKKYDLPSNRKNHKYQVFYWEKGKTYRAYYDEDKKQIKKEEFAYIHFKNGKNIECKINDIAACKSFFITRGGFIEKKEGVPSLDEIKKYNPYPGKIYEYLEKKYYFLRKKIHWVV